MRRDGVQLQAEVVDYDKRPGDRAGGYYLRPIVRFYLNERSYQSTVSNQAGNGPAPLGSFMTIVVSPKAPYSPYDPYSGTAVLVWAAFGLLLVATGVPAWAIGRL